MTTARQRRRPEGASPIALTPKVEPLPTPAAPEPVAAGAPAVPVAVPAAAPQPAPDEPAPAAAVAVQQVAPAPPQVREEDRKVSRTFDLRESLLREAQTAVLRTGQFDGGYRSLNALVVGALERELVRLAGEFNDGVKFPMHRGSFRTGRPMGG